MITETATEPTATSIATAPKLPKSATTTLTAPGSTMQIVAERTSAGARTYVLTTDASKKSARGMTENHPTFEAAATATHRMAKAAEKLGWQRKAARRGF